MVKGKLAHSRRLASPPLRPVWFDPAPSRGQMGSIPPQAKVRRPYDQALRVGGTINEAHPRPKGFQTGTKAKAPVGSKLWRDAQNR